MISALEEPVTQPILERVGDLIGAAQERRHLPADLYESDDAYLAIFDAPGSTTTDVEVRYREGTLEVHIERFRGFHDGYEIRVPGRGRSLDGRVTLPDGARVDPDAATATLRDDGTLAVRLPKTTPVPERR